MESRGGQRQQGAVPLRREQLRAQGALAQVHCAPEGLQRRGRDHRREGAADRPRIWPPRCLHLLRLYRSVEVLLRPPRHHGRRPRQLDLPRERRAARVHREGAHAGHELDLWFPPPSCKARRLHRQDRGVLRRHAEARHARRGQDLHARCHRPRILRRHRGFR